MDSAIFSKSFKPHMMCLSEAFPPQGDWGFHLASGLGGGAYEYDHQHSQPSFTPGPTRSLSWLEQTEVTQT